MNSKKALMESTLVKILILAAFAAVMAGGVYLVMSGKASTIMASVLNLF